ncbi:type II secretion system minor pseudopilin GspI [Pseudomonas sp. GD03860]|uniref:type II secretion system minor pseudopilin GspI n=1 Tax=Pseudomonas TaxID=286 RepID=UPI00236474C4|nr:MULTISPECIES: type II secretion system minor pseudopilin GspI [Pseudomonas]MDD2058608.1 type II secretion system minor pseudopilin GspI [Pseudomonas putida]MDH0640797.1 type II secretion system minor pseudopilin GspI [Pseudomonas sp. GD03860]
MNSRARGQRGFTLLEIMIALVVFATLAAAVMTASQYALKQNVRLEEQLIGAWLADNHLNELRLQAAPPLGRQQMSRHFDRRDWTLDQLVAVSADAHMLQVDLAVRPAGGERVVYRSLGWLAVHDE